MCLYDFRDDTVEELLKSASNKRPVYLFALDDFALADWRQKNSSPFLGSILASQYKEVEGIDSILVRDLFLDNIVNVQFPKDHPNIRYYEAEDLPSLDEGLPELEDDYVGILGPADLFDVVNHRVKRVGIIDDAEDEEEEAP